VQRPEVRGHSLCADAIAVGLGIIPREIVSHFRLYLNVAVNVERSPASKTKEIFRRRRVAEPVIVGKIADLNVIRILG
jgi:hypothetical protein